MLADAVCVCWDWGSGIGLNSVVKLLGGRGAFYLVSSGWWHLVGRCCFVFAGIGLWHWALLGRQAAWRLRCIVNGVVWLMASCWQMLIVFAGIGLWLRAQFRSSSCLAAGCNREMSSSLLAAQWKRLLCSVIVIKSFDGKRGILRLSSCLAAKLRSLGKSFESTRGCVVRGPLSKT